MLGEKKKKKNDAMILKTSERIEDCKHFNDRLEECRSTTEKLVTNSYFVQDRCILKNDSSPKIKILSSFHYPYFVILKVDSLSPHLRC